MEALRGGARCRPAAAALPRCIQHHSRASEYTVELLIIGYCIIEPLSKIPVPVSADAVEVVR